MFENITAEVLNRLLGSYVSPTSFSADRVSTSVYKGHVVLSKLELRQDILDRLLLPVSMKKGLIMRAEISIPWTQLGSKPIELVLDGVYVMFNPKTDWSEEELERRAQASKAAKLVQAELIKRSKEAVAGIGKLVEGSTSDASFTSRLMSKITDNVEIKVRNVHLRFEDSRTFCFGMTLESFSVVTTDANWVPRFKENQDGQTYKLCNFDRFSIYGDMPTSTTASFALFSGGDDEFIKFFAEGIPHQDRSHAHSYIIRPMDASLRMTISRDSPTIFYNFTCKSLDVRLEMYQITSALYLSKVLSTPPTMPVAVKMGLKRPTASPMQDPRGWWQYAYAFVLKQVKERRHKWSRAFFAKRRRDRLEYQALWKRHVMGAFSSEENRSYSPLNTQERVRLEWLEKCLDFDDIILFRSLAEHELRLEKAHQELWDLTFKNASGGTLSASSVAAASGWVAWALGSSASQNQGNSAGKELISLQDLERFRTVLKQGPSPVVLEHNTSPNDALVSAVVSFHIPKGSLFSNPVRLSFRGADLELTRRVSGNSILSFALEYFQVNDGFQRVLGPRGDFFRKIKRKRSATMDDLSQAESFAVNGLSTVSVQRLESLESLDLASPNFNAGGDEGKSMSSKKRKEDGIIFFSLDTRPPSNSEIDSAVVLKIGPLEAVYSRRFIGKVKDTLETISQAAPGLPSSASSSLPSRNAVALDLDIRNSLLIAPFSSRSACAGESDITLLVDVGRFSIQDQAIRTKAQIALAKESQNDQDERLFDTYTVHLSRISAGFTQRGADVAAKRMPLVDKFSVRATFGRSVQPSSAFVPRMRLSIEGIEVINIRLSGEKLALLLRLVDALMPKIDVSVDDSVELRESYQRCPFVHRVPDGEDDEITRIINEASQTSAAQGDGISQVEGGNSIDFDASSEFFSVLGDEMDGRESFVSRNQRFFDALNADDSQSEVRTVRTKSSRRHLSQRMMLRHSSTDLGPETVISEDDQRSFFTADSSFRKSGRAPSIPMNNRLIRQASQMSFNHRDIPQLQLSVHMAGIAVYFSQQVTGLPEQPSQLTLKSTLGSPLSGLTYQRHLLYPSSTSIRRNGSSINSLYPGVLATPQMANRNDLPHHVQSWLDELRDVQPEPLTSTGVVPMVPLPSASPIPESSPIKEDDAISQAQSSVARADSGSDEEDSEGGGWTEGDADDQNNSERICLVARLESFALESEWSLMRRTTEISLGHIIVEELSEAGSEDLFSRYIVHTGLRVNDNEQLSYSGEDDEPVFVGHVESVLLGHRKQRDSVKHSEAAFTVQRPIDLILNERVLQNSLVPCMSDISSAFRTALGPTLKKPNERTMHALELAASGSTLQSLAKLSAFIDQLRFWVVRANNAPLASLKLGRLDVIVEQDSNGKVHGQGRLFRVNGYFFPSQQGRLPFIFLSKGPEAEEDDNIPLLSFVGIHHPTQVDKNETVVTPPQAACTPAAEDIADNVIDSILLSSQPSRQATPAEWSFVSNATDRIGELSKQLLQKSPAKLRTVLESVHVNYSGDEMFVNVLPLRLALCQEFLMSIASFTKAFPSIDTGFDSRMEANAAPVGGPPLSLRFTMTNPTLELIEESSGSIIAFTCTRFDIANKLFLSSVAGENEALLVRTDATVVDAELEVNEQRVTSEKFETRLRMIETQTKLSFVSNVDLRVNQEQIRVLGRLLGSYVELATSSMPTGGSGTSKSSFTVELDQFNIWLIAQLVRPVFLNEKRALLVRNQPGGITGATSMGNFNGIGSGSASPSSSRSGTYSMPVTQAPPVAAATVSAPTCFAIVRLSQIALHVTDFCSYRLSLGQVNIQQGYATLRKNHYIQLVSIPEPMLLQVSLDPSTLLMDTIAFHVANPRLVYVPEAISDVVAFCKGLETLPHGAGGDGSRPASPRDRASTSESGRQSEVIEEHQYKASLAKSEPPGPSFSKAIIKVESMEFWCGGGNFSKTLVVLSWNSCAIEVDSRYRLSNVALRGCAMSLRKDLQLPTMSNVIAFHRTVVGAGLQVPAGPTHLNVMTSAIEEEHITKTCLQPFELDMTRLRDQVEIVVSPIYINTSYSDVEAFSKLASDFDALALRSQPVKANRKIRRKDYDALKAFKTLKIHARSVTLVYFNPKNFAIARLTIGDFLLEPGESADVLGRCVVRVHAEHHFKREWEVMMETCEFLGEILSSNRLRVFCGTPIQINLTQSLFDGRDTGKEESEKIMTLINHSGLSIKQIHGRDHDMHHDYFCSIGESLSFRMSNRHSKRSWLLDPVVCPRRGKMAKYLALLEEQAEDPMSELLFPYVTLIVEAEAASSSLLIKSPLLLKNQTPQPLEFAVSLGTPHPTFNLLAAAESSSSLGSHDIGSETPSRSTTPDSFERSASPSAASNATLGKRARARSRTGLGQSAWSATLAPNDSVYVPADIAHIVLTGRYPLLCRPRAQVSSAPDYAFADLRLSNSIQVNQRNAKKNLAFTDFGSFSPSGGPKESVWTSYYVVESCMTDPYSHCVVFSAPVVLVNHLNSSVTYRIGTDANKAEGQLPVSAELKWHGQQPQTLNQIRLQIKLEGFEWSESVLLLPGQSDDFNDWDETERAVYLDLRDDGDRVLRVTATVLARTAGGIEVALSVPYWIVNNTDLPVLFASSMMESLGSRVSAGQSRTIARMRRIRLMNQLEEEFRSRKGRRTSHHSHNRTRILSASGAAPTGLLEIFDWEDSTNAHASIEDNDDNDATMLSGGGGPVGIGENGSTIMFSSPNVRIRFWDSRWSDNCFLEHSNHQVIECKQEWRVRDPALSRALYSIAVKVEQSKTSPRTKIVTMSPRFILVNALDRALKVRQWRGNLGELARGRSSLSSHPIFSGGREARITKDRFASTRGSGIVSLSPGERVPFHWRDKSGPKQVSACFDEFGWEWSSGIQIEDCVGEFCTRLRNRHTQRVYILRVDVQMVDDSSVLITFRQELPGLPPYRIDNLSLQTIRFRQVGAPVSSSETLLPYHSCAYTWDLLDNEKRLLVETIARTDELDGGDFSSGSDRLFSWPLSSAASWLRSAHAKQLGIFSLDKNFGFLLSALSHVGVSLQADGPTRVLTISDARVMSATAGAPSHLPPIVAAHLGNQNDQISGDIDAIQFSITLKDMGVSMIAEEQAQRKELLRLAVRDCEIRTGRTEEGDPEIDFELGDLQIDNQLMKAAYPVLLCSSRRDKIDPRSADDDVEAQALGDKFLRAKLVKSDRFPSLDFLKSFRLTLAPIQLNLEAEIIREALRFASSIPQASQTEGRNRIHERTDAQNSSKKSYVEDLRIDPVQVRVNFRGALALFGATQWFGAHLEGASLYLKEFRIVHSLLSASDPIANRVLAHYSQALRRQWYVLVSSVDLFGDPIGLAKTIVGGIRESLGEIVHSISIEGGFTQFKRGLKRAGWVLVRAAVVGVSSSIINVCNGIASALQSLSGSPFMEEDFRKPRGFFQTSVQGFAGLAILPFRGYERRGSRGFAIGLVKGLIGTVVGPISGALRLLARVSDALRGAVDPTSKVRTQRMRTPRFLRADQPLGVFDPKRAEGEEALWLMAMTSENYMNHMHCSDRLLVVFTEEKLIVISKFNRELLCVLFVIPRIDVVYADYDSATCSPNNHAVILSCLPPSPKETYWIGARNRLALNSNSKRIFGISIEKVMSSGPPSPIRHRGRRRPQFGGTLLRFTFDERIIRCGSEDQARELVSALSHWIRPSRWLKSPE